LLVSALEQRLRVDVGVQLRFRDPIAQTTPWLLQGKKGKKGQKEATLEYPLYPFRGLVGTIVGSLGVLLMSQFLFLCLFICLFVFFMTWCFILFG